MLVYKFTIINAKEKIHFIFMKSEIPVDNI